MDGVRVLGAGREGFQQEVLGGRERAWQDGRECLRQEAQPKGQGRALLKHLSAHRLWANAGSKKFSLLFQ